MATSLEEAKQVFIAEYGPSADEDGMFEDCYEVPDADLDKLMFSDMDWARCECGKELSPSDGDWRFNGRSWEHSHGYPVGHVAATSKKTFREELSRRLAMGDGPGLFASTDY